MQKQKNKKGPRFRNFFASVRDVLYFSFETISGANRNIITITQGLHMLDELIKSSIERKYFVDELPSGKLSRMLKRKSF